MATILGNVPGVSIPRPWPTRRGNCASPTRSGWLLASAWHHNLTGGPAQDDYLDPRFLQLLIDSGVSLGMHGHQHRTEWFDERYRLGSNDRRMVITSAATLCAGPSNLSPGSPRGYNVLEIDNESWTARLHQRQMVNLQFDMPMWGPGHFIDTHLSYVDFDLSPPMLARPAGLDLKMALESADVHLGKGEWTRVLEALAGHMEDALARKMCAKALGELDDADTTIRVFANPQTAEEAVLLGDAIPTWSSRGVCPVLDGPVRRCLHRRQRQSNHISHQSQDSQMSDGIILQVETSRVLQLLATEIYDSPLAMLRENLQNAYDAVRERFAMSGTLENGGQIDIRMDGNTITITDNGVGMDERSLRENFWKAGSSGKHSERAKKAGVVGTFGIGAMANFGVCSHLEIVTRSINESEALRSVAERDTLKIGEECITFDKLQDDRPVGTTLVATLDASNSILPDQAKSYLAPYVSLLPVPVRLNGELISTKSMIDALPPQVKTFSPLGSIELNQQGFKARFSVSADTNGQVLIIVTDISISETPITGEMALLQGGGQLMGLRSLFGLAPIPVAGNYQFGGFANLPFLQPTAGRDALNRDSINQATTLVSLAERAASQCLADTTLADRSNSLLSWISTNGRYDLAKRVTILVHPNEENVALGDLKNYVGTRTAYQYGQNDKGIIGTFANENSFVVQVSPNQPRRKVQQQYLTSILKIQQIPTSAQILKVYAGKELEIAEASVLFRIASILRDDYWSDVEVFFAEISHKRYCPD